MNLVKVLKKAGPKGVLKRTWLRDSLADQRAEHTELRSGKGVDCASKERNESKENRMNCGSLIVKGPL